MKNIYYSFNDLKIVGVTQRGIYATSDYLFVNNDDDSSTDIEHFYLLFSKPQWNKLQKEWISAKQDYCERYGHFCGWGGIRSNAYICGNGTKTIWTGENPESVTVDVYKVKDIMVEMEHG